MRTSPAAVGNVVPMSGASDGVPAGSPPTSYAAFACLTGEPGSIIRFSALTVLRSLIIAPGLIIAGVRGKQLVYGSLAASGVVSVSALVYCYSLAQTAKQKAAASNVINTTGA